jgi:hypothetical protein
VNDKPQGPDADERRDPFLDDEAPVWDYVFRKGAMVFTALADLDTVFDVMRALKDMPESDLKSMILERLYACMRRRTILHSGRWSGFGNPSPIPS